MKLNKKIILPALSLLAGASLIGSVSGTVAWYQYSTKSNVSYIGTSGGTIGNLQLRIRDYAGEGGEWGPNLYKDDVANYLSYMGYAQQVQPVTPGPLAYNGYLIEHTWVERVAFDSGDGAPAAHNDGKDLYVDTTNHKLYTYANDEWDAGVALEHDIENPNANNADVDDYFFNDTSSKLYQAIICDKPFYANPQFGIGAYEHWIKATDECLVRLPLQLRFLGKDESDLSAEEIYLSKLVIQADRLNGAHGDISDAIRVHFSAYTEGDPEHAINHLVSNKGGTTLTHGKLKLGRGSDFDKAYDDEFGFDGSDFTYINYGGDSGEQVCYGNMINANASAKYYDEEGPWNRIHNFSSGVVAPEDENGADGDFYYNSNTNKLYQKDSGSWGAGDVAFSFGTANPTAETDPDGKDYYVNTASGQLFLSVPAHNETVQPLLVENVPNSLEIRETTEAKRIGTTLATAEAPAPQKYLNVDVTIWVEGWHKFERNGLFSSIWDGNFIGAIFDVGFQFAADR